jgi:hypothetical protein
MFHRLHQRAMRDLARLGAIIGSQARSHDLLVNIEKALHELLMPTHHGRQALLVLHAGAGCKQLLDSCWAGHVCSLCAVRRHIEREL